MKTHHWMDHLKFFVPSLLGIYLFMTPVQTSEGFSIPIAVLAGMVESRLTNYLSLIMMLIIVLTAILTIVMKVIGKERLAGKEFIQRLFLVNLFWTIVRVLAAVFAIMVYFKIGSEIIYGEDTGQLLLGDLLHVLFSIFIFAGLFLPLLTNFGLLELIGVFMTKIMRPLFKLPGRSSIDALASLIGVGTIGVLLTSNQYEDGFYTKREAAVIGTTFSIVSITFSLVIISEMNLSHMFLPFYMTIMIAGFVDRKSTRLNSSHVAISYAVFCL